MMERRTPPAEDAVPDAAILLVDDRPDNLDVLEHILRDLGRPIVRAGSGQEALRRLLERDFAVILLDVRMPDMDGYETAALIRGRRRSRHTPILFLTAFDPDREQLARAYQVGAADFIFKPVVAEILRSKVSVFLELMEKTALIQRQLEALRRGEECFRALAETAHDAIVSADAAGRIIYFNRAAERIFGHAAAEAVGRPLTELFHEGVELLAPGAAAEVAGRRKDGSEFPLEVSLARWHAGQETCVTAILRDVSERKRAEEERERMNVRLLQGQKLQALGQLAAGVAHEINNPTSYLLSNFGTLEDYFRELEGFAREAAAGLDALEPREDVAAARDRLRGLRERRGIDGLLADGLAALKDCRHGAEKIRDIVRTLREYAHPDERELGAVDLRAVVEGAVRLCGNEFRHRIRLRTDLEALPAVRGHARQLEQVFVNLLVNASQAIAERGEVEIVGRLEGGQAVVRLRDSGCGIPEEHLPKLFEPFFTTKPVGQGTGLGLYLVHGIVGRHEGRIDVVSSRGRGTEFTIRLPAIGTEGTAHAPHLEAGRAAVREGAAGDRGG